MIRCEQLSKRYGKNVALNQLNLQIGAGELHGFVGPNGAGKTTTMKILATLTRPTSGNAYVDGISVVENPQKARRLVGYMPDFFGVYDNLKVWEYLDMYAGCMEIGPRERRRKMDALLELTALADKREAYVDALSRGMKQRLCLARALLHDPKLLILDEPASGMDPRSRAQMREILSEVSAMEKTVLISSHILPELAQMCSHVTILERGQAKFSGSVKALEKQMHLDQALTIRFYQPPDEQMAQALEACTQKILGTKPVHEQQDVWYVPGAEHRDRDGELLAAMMALQAPVCDFHRERASLERVFLEVTQDENQSVI